MVIPGRAWAVIPGFSFFPSEPDVEADELTKYLVSFSGAVFVLFIF